MCSDTTATVGESGGIIDYNHRDYLQLKYDARVGRLFEFSTVCRVATRL